MNREVPTKEELKALAAEKGVWVSFAIQAYSVPNYVATVTEFDEGEFIVQSRDEETVLWAVLGWLQTY